MTRSRVEPRPRTHSWPFILVQRQPRIVDFGMGRSWSANQRRPHSAKENIDDFLEKEIKRRPATAGDVPPANREFRTYSLAAHPPSYASCRNYYEHLPLRTTVSALATEKELRQLWKAGPALLRHDAGTALDAAAAAVPADTGASAQADSWLREDGERAPPGGSAEAGAASTEGLDDCERAPPGGSAEAGAAATEELDDGERAASGGSAQAGAARWGWSITAAKHGMLQMTSTIMQPPPTTARCRRTPHCRPARPRVGPRRRRRRRRSLASMGGGVAARRRQRRPTHGADLYNPRRPDRRW